MIVISKIPQFLLKLFSVTPKDGRIKEILRVLGEEKVRNLRNDEKIAIQGVEDPFFFGLFASIVNDLRKNLDVYAEVIQIRSINGAVGVGLQAKFLRSWIIANIFNAQWARVNRYLIGGIAYRCQPLFWNLGQSEDRRQALYLWNELKLLEYPEHLKNQGIQIGDLVIDSYLRYRPSPRFNVQDPFVLKVLQQAVRNIRLAKMYFEKQKPKLYLSSYSAYIEHGIPVRVALSLGVIVRTYGNFIEIGKKLSPEDFHHTVDTSKYSHKFHLLPEQRKKIALDLADKELGFRLSGGVDTATSYMKKSAYHSSGDTVPDVSGAVIIFLHDFYDSPHIYDDLLFTDFWSWLTFTIETLTEAKIPFWIKPHPNQISLSEEVIADLRKIFTNIRFISPKVTNVELVKAGMLCGVTVYGTVAHELAYMGIPSIACARNPHASFEFCRTAKNLAQYKQMLLTPEVLPLSKRLMREQSLAFYYMHNLDGTPNELSLRRGYADFLKTFNDSMSAPKDVVGALLTLKTLPGWDDHLTMIKKDLNWDGNRKRSNIQSSVSIDNDHK